MEEELEIEEQVEEELEREEWTFEKQQPDALQELKSEIQSLKQQLSQVESTDYTTELRKEIMGDLAKEISPVLEEVRRPAAISRIVNTVCKGLGEEARAYVEDYFNQQGASATALDHIRTKDEASMKLIRAAAESVELKSKKSNKAAPVSEGSSKRDEGNPTDEKQIRQEAAILANTFGTTIEAAMKILKEQYANA